MQFIARSHWIIRWQHVHLRNQTQDHECPPLQSPHHEPTIANRWREHSVLIWHLLISMDKGSEMFWPRSHYRANLLGNTGFKISSFNHCSMIRNPKWQTLQNTDVGDDITYPYSFSHPEGGNLLYSHPGEEPRNSGITSVLVPTIHCHHRFWEHGVHYVNITIA